MEIAREKLIIALDDIGLKEALLLVEETIEFASTYKIGLAMFSAYGPALLNELKNLGAKVFLDLKFHDIPMQVSKAVERSLAYAPRFLTLHALGGGPMLKAASEVARGSSTTLLAVTVLTSFDQRNWHSLGFNNTIEDGVLGLAKLATDSGISGLVCSPLEAGRLKEKYASTTLVCPGVRQHFSNTHDQVRTMTAQEAILAGAGALVVGRPILAAKNPKDSARSFFLEIGAALSVREKYALS